jgi:TolA-binding protein
MNEKWTDSSIPMLLLCLILVLALWACPQPSSMQPTAGSTATSTGEAEKTRKMEEKAAEIRRMEEDLRNMQGTDQEKIDAANKIDEARRELTEMQDDSGSSTQ